MAPETLVAEPPAATPVAVPRRRRPHEATVALVLLLLAAGLLLMYAGRYLTFFYDEWTFIMTRRGGGIDTYLAPHNGHLSLFPVVVYKLLFATAGLRHYWPYRLAVTLLHLVCAALLYVLARRRMGAVPALVPTVLLLALGTAWQDLLWPFQIGYLGSIAAGLGALALLDLPGPGRDGWAGALLVGSVLSSGVGIAFAVACGVLLVAQRAAWRRLWIAILPLVVYAVWYVGWGGGEHTTADAVLAAPQYVADAAAGAVAGLAGLNESTWGPALALALLAVLVLEWRRRFPGLGPSPMLLTAAAGAIVFWVLAAIARATEADPTASRYVYVGAVFILLAASEARLGAALRGGWLIFAGLLLLGALVGNVSALRGGERGLRAADTSVRASLTAVEVAAPIVSPAFLPDQNDAPQLAAGPYLAAVHDLGSPAFSVPELRAAPETTREKADSVLVQAERLAASPTARVPNAGAPPGVDYRFGGALSVRGGCYVFAPTASLGSLGVRVFPGGGLIVQPSRGPAVTLYARRFADSFTGTPFATLSRAAPQTIRFPADRQPGVPWHVQVVAGSPVTVCAGG
jgi:hypothetical protein